MSNRECVLCNRTFVSQAARQSHVNASSRHPRCDRCQRGFLNADGLRAHLTSSRAHHYCARCERDFSNSTALQQHLDMAAVHREDSDEESDTSSAGDPYEYSVSADEDDSDEEDDNEEEEDEDEDEDSDESSDEEVDSDYLAHSEDESDTSLHTPYAQSSDLYLSTRTPIRPLTTPAAVHSTQGTPNDKPSSSSPVLTGAASWAADAGLGASAVKSNMSSGPSNGYSCPLCYDQKDDLSSVRCGHVFCTPCINRALENKHECPICRSHATVKGLRRIYLTF